MSNFVYPNESYAIQGAIIEVYRNLGSGFLENVYQEALSHEFTIRNIPFTAQPELKLYYKGIQLKQTYKPDFICFDLIIVELKTVNEIANAHQAQVKNYLKATGFHLGILVNFSHYPGVEMHRIVL